MRRVVGGEGKGEMKELAQAHAQAGMERLAAVHVMSCLINLIMHLDIKLQTAMRGVHSGSAGGGGVLLLLVKLRGYGIH